MDITDHVPSPGMSAHPEHRPSRHWSATLIAPRYGCPSEPITRPDICCGLGWGAGDAVTIGGAGDAVTTGGTGGAVTIGGAGDAVTTGGTGGAVTTDSVATCGRVGVGVVVKVSVAIESVVEPGVSNGDALPVATASACVVSILLGMVVGVAPGSSRYEPAAKVAADIRTTPATPAAASARRRLRREGGFAGRTVRVVELAA
jgi:hypothetical protein